MAFPTTGILDTFTGPDETPISTNWSGPIYPGLGELRRISNQLLPPAAAFGGSWFDVATYGPDCEAYLTIVTKPSDGNQVILYARAQNLNTTSLDGYIAYLNPQGGADRFRIAREDNGSDTNLDIDDTIEWANGDKIGIACIGTNIQGWRCPVSTGVWGQVLDANDATYALAGSIAVAVDNGAFVGDDLGGGTIGGPSPGDNPPNGIVGRGAGW